MRNITVFRPAFLTLTMSLALTGQVNVLTQHNDAARTGANLQETKLNTSNVNGTSFGKLAFRLVDGNVYAQPLIVSGAKITTRPSPVNVAIVATENNSVYAFDADDTNQASTTAQLWQTPPAVLGHAIDSLELYTALGVPTCSDLTTQIGITGTPVIKITGAASPSEGVVFVAAKSKVAGKYVYNLFALDLASGGKLASLAIAGSVKGTGIGATGAGANRIIAFDPKLELNRPGLLLDGNILYVVFGGHCDAGKYHGWVFAYDVSNPKAPKKLDVFCSTPNGTGGPAEGRAGIWMSGQGAAADGDGNIYFVTGDGTNNAGSDLGDSVVKLKLVNGKFQVQDWYSPQNQAFLKVNDVDLGASGATLIPASHLLLAGSKEGRLYLIDRNQMGKGTGLSLQSFQVTHGPNPPTFYNLHGAPVIWQRAGDMFVYVIGEEDPVKQYHLIPDTGPGGAGWKFEATTPLHTSPESAPYPDFPTGLFGQAFRDAVWMPGGFLSLSANGDTPGSGILWVNMPFAASANHFVVRGVLRAYDASDVSKGELWDSENTGSDADRLGQFAKFCPPTVANGKVYAVTFQQEIVTQNGVHQPMPGGDQPALVIYGLK